MRNPIKDLRQNGKAKNAAAIGGAATLFALSQTDMAQAQQAQVRILSTELQADGNLLVVLSDGRQSLIGRDDFTLVDGKVRISQPMLVALGVEEEDDGGGLFAVLGAVAAAGAGIALAASGSGNGDVGNDRSAGGGTGGDGNGGETGGGAMGPPLAFTSSNSATVGENASDTIYRATATGDSVTYSLTGGADAGLFTLDSATGALRFTNPPDFENPADSDSNNLYLVEVTASDGSDSVAQTLQITVNDVDDSIVVTDPGGGTGFVITGSAAGGQTVFGAVLSGDFNGDGIADMLVSSPNSNSVYAIYGGPTNSDIDLGSLTPAQGFALSNSGSGEATGAFLDSLGDINGDGFDDIVISAYANDESGTDAGKVFVVYGGANPGNVDLQSMTPSQGFTVLGAAAGDRAGWGLSRAGDINDDGLDDIFVGAWANDDGGNFAGKAYIIYGATSQMDIDLADPLGGLGFSVQGQTVIDGSDRLADTLGYSGGSAGDVNGDGIADLIIGLGEDEKGGKQAGSALILYGSESPVDVDMADPVTSAQGFFIIGAAAGDRLGYSVGQAGDMNGDGFDDLVVSSFLNDDAGTDAGKAYVIYGGAGLTDINLGSLSPSDGFSIAGGAAGDELGFSLASAGDINGDGFDDLLVGARVDDTPATVPGEAYLIYGGQNLSDIDVSSLSEQQGFAIAGEANGDSAGNDVSGAGDVNGDGFDDIIIAAPGNDRGGADAGAAFVIFGGATGTEQTQPVTDAGTAGSDNFTGNAGADSFTDIGAGDVVRAGVGDDRVGVTGTDFARIDGGNGRDTLSLDGAGLALDLTNDRAALAGFEILDLDGSGANFVTIDKSALLALSDDTRGGITSFTVRGSADDGVTVDDAAGSFAAAGTRTIDAITYDVYESGQAELLVEQAVTVLL